jgi:uncharacterized cupredoxin-like copper-binding protein
MKMKLLITTFFFAIAALLSLAACGGERLPTQQITIQGMDIMFNKNTLTVKAGQPIELVYQNVGAIDHAFMIDGMVPAEKIHPGQSKTFDFTVQKTGSYKFICAIPGHEMAGMVGTLVVE